MCIKIDRKLFMNYICTFFGGILGAMVIAFALDQVPVNKGIIFLIFTLLVFGVGLLVIGFINFAVSSSPKKK
jgi:hypothetical protein